MILPSRSTVPVHLGIALKTTVQTSKGYVNMIMVDMITGYCFLSKIKSTLGDLTVIVGKGLRAMER